MNFFNYVHSWVRLNLAVFGLYISLTYIFHRAGFWHKFHDLILIHKLDDLIRFDIDCFGYISGTVHLSTNDESQLVLHYNIEG